MAARLLARRPHRTAGQHEDRGHDDAGRSRRRSARQTGRVRPANRPGRRPTVGAGPWASGSGLAAHATPVWCSICRMKRTLLAAVVALALPVGAFAQAQTSLSSLRVSYTTRKNTVKPQGELKAQIDQIDQQLADATRIGRTGEVRRLI